MNENGEKKCGRHRSGWAAGGMRFVGGVCMRLCLVVLFALVLAVVVMWLWNWLMPGIFGIGEIRYWQAFGLMILARLLIGTLGIHGRGHRWHDRTHWGDRFKYHRYCCGDADRGTHVNNTMKWWHNYKEFWRDEGKAAFEQYMKRAGKKDDVKDKKKA